MMSNNGRVLLAATVTDVAEGTFVYPACEQCYSKLTVSQVKSCQLYRCHNCKSVYNPDEESYRYRLCLTVTDSSMMANVTAFGGMLNSFFGVTAKEFYNKYISATRDKYGMCWENIVQAAVEQAFVGQRLLFGLKTATNFGTKLAQAKHFGLTLKEIWQNVDVSKHRSTIRQLPEFVAVQVMYQTDSSRSATVVECLQHLQKVIDQNHLTLDLCADKAALLQIWNHFSTYKDGHVFSESFMRTRTPQHPSNPVSLTRASTLSHPTNSACVMKTITPSHPASSVCFSKASTPSHPSNPVSFTRASTLLHPTNPACFTKASTPSHPTSSVCFTKASTPSSQLTNPVSFSKASTPSHPNCQVNFRELAFCHTQLVQSMILL